MTSTPGGRLFERLRPILLPAAIVAAVVVLLIRARDALERTPRFTVDPSACSVTQRPPWVSDELARFIAFSVSRGLGKRASLLDTADLQSWAVALAEASPWIESVEGLSPRFPAQADVRVHLRRPVLTVDGDILVAASGHVLGPGPVSIDPPPLAYAGRHLDADYRECAAAAGELVGHREELRNLGVRVMRVGIGADDTVVFTTDTGAELSWGRSARKSPLSYLDLPPEARLANLRQVLVDFPALKGVRRVQLWTDRPVVYKRATQG